MAGLNFFVASLASPSRWSSKSSRNFKNMIQVSIGNRSRSPFSPLSLRMMSRADLMSEASDWTVVAFRLLRIDLAIGACFHLQFQLLNTKFGEPAPRGNIFGI